MAWSLNTLFPRTIVLNNREQHLKMQILSKMDRRIISLGSDLFFYLNYINKYFKILNFTFPSEIRERLKTEHVTKAHTCSSNNRTHNLGGTVGHSIILWLNFISSPQWKVLDWNSRKHTTWRIKLKPRAEETRSCPCLAEVRTIFNDGNIFGNSCPHLTFDCPCGV